MNIRERLPRETGRDYALRVIKENILDLTLEPGSQISENELSAQLGLSRTPVREALIELNRAQIVEIRPQRKTTVSLIDYKLVDEARFTRSLLECAVVALACDMATEEDLAQMRENVRLQQFYLDSYYPDSLMTLDNEFHATLFRIAQKEQTCRLLEGITIHFERVRSMALTTVKNHRIVADHAAILDAVAQRNAALAQEQMKTHLNRYMIDEAAIRERYPQYFK
ncbi:MAG: GntR family transcriptional regulator [Oscillospiraceae bacterium]|nr:GntR family transcriptional regulator [Oscillospiraceae bacterium]